MISGLLQKDVALALGVTKDRVFNWETGRTRPAKWHRERVAGFISEDQS